jgi:hypothetical protein
VTGVASAAKAESCSNTARTEMIGRTARTGTRACFAASLAMTIIIVREQKPTFIVLRVGFFAFALENDNATHHI